ncbi:hypothetical protein [Fructobacillus fructosus]|uniref:DUF4238 domain-containing protein n=1 Tax=Fructobacillus fructosus TaxID=1631 RepID=A0ABM9N0B8_9LACO|nr:unnamed protein product [Fructobacillus fructosus]CAK1228944.1 unnamed protein product [Fructobacillus fructosus]CAK1235809.1 unnamed protein product [Fructobacillus fructosus]CAK1245730.1 unnamed protein product [Fructobacillus fructosus]CAK1252186.1 unnamed protein product [Fructobacillus fructosus]
MKDELKYSIIIGSKPEVGLPYDWENRLTYYHSLEIAFNIVTLQWLSVEQTLPLDGHSDMNIVLRNVAGEFLFKEPITVHTLQNHDELYRSVQQCIRLFDCPKYFVAPDKAMKINRILTLPIRNQEVLTQLFSDGADLQQEIDNLFFEEYEQYRRVNEGKKIRYEN